MSRLAAGKRSVATDSFGSESRHLRSLSLRVERGNHTIYFCELPRVTVRVNLGAKRGYVRP
jgi:hypothetical protein